jgi:hypothetical protein
VTDPVSICNAALSFAGQKPITSLDADDTEAARLCAANYPAAVKAVLEERGWTFATGWTVLAPADAAPADAASPEFSRRFLLPATVLRVLQCDDGSGSFELEWKREGEYILADCATLHVRAIQLIDDPKLWTGNFAIAVAYRLAALLAIPLTENRSLHADLVQLYQEQIRQAGALDGTQGRREPARASRISRARW